MITGSVALPFGKLPTVPYGDVTEPIGDAARAGANAIDSIVRALTGASAPVDPQAARATRPLLATVTAAVPPLAVAVAGDTAPVPTTTHLHFDATAPGNDWGASGRESAMVAVYVDGRYHSTVIVMEERSGGYTVNLGSLPPGSHDIELRSAHDIADSGSAAAQVSGVSLQTVTGQQAEIDAHAPIIELRGRGPAHGHQSSVSASSDAPLVLVPVVTQLADGTRNIGYHVAFTNEDGGTLIPDLFTRYGRGTDYECVYTVHLSADGRVLDEQYQAPIHKWVAFDGMRENGRPVLRVSSANNMVSAHLSAGAVERWSDAAIGPVAATVTDTQVMTANPWIWAVMGKELLREGKAVTTGEPGRRQVVDARRYLYLGPLTTAALAAIVARGGVDVELADGRWVRARAVTGAGIGVYHVTALELPDGAYGDAVRGVSLLGCDAMVLDHDFRPHTVTNRPAAATDITAVAA